MKKIFNKILCQIKICSKGAFTLMEALVTILIFSLITAGLYSSLLIGNKHWQTSQIKIELQQELRKAMEGMKDDLRQAGPSSIVNVPADNIWYSSITFKIPVGVTSGTISWDSNTIGFVLGGTNSGQLQKIYNSVTKVIAQDITTLQFRRLSSSSNILEVAMVAQKDTPFGLTIQDNLNFKVKLRN